MFTISVSSYMGIALISKDFPFKKNKLSEKKLLPSENIFYVLRTHPKLKMAASKLVQHGDRFDDFGVKNRWEWLVKTATERCAHKRYLMRTFANAALFGLCTGLCTQIPVLPPPPPPPPL